MTVDPRHSIRVQRSKRHHPSLLNIWSIWSQYSLNFFPGWYLIRNRWLLLLLSSTVTTTNTSLTPPDSRLSGGISMSSFFSCETTWVRVSFLSRVVITLQFCITSDNDFDWLSLCRLFNRIISPVQTVSSIIVNISPQISEADRQDCL